MSGLRYWKSCVDFSPGDTSALFEMIDDAITVTRRTFLKHVDAASRLQLEKALSYETHAKRGLTCAGDYHVSYHRSKYNGRRVYFMRHSSIEHIFREEVP